MKRWKIKSSSMLNAVFLCLLISILCGALILIASYNKIFQEKLTVQQALIAQNNSAFTYFLKNNPPNSDIFYSRHDLEIGSMISQKRWGLFKVQTIKSFFGNDTVSKSAFVIPEKSTNNLALYLTDYDKLLNLSGAIRISGDISIPQAHFQKSHIGQKPNNILFKGSQKKSIDKLPQLRPESREVFNTDYRHYPEIDYEPGRIMVNEFDEPTKIFRVAGGALDDVSLKGNIVVLSESPLHLINSSRLEDVIVKAPKIIFESGFRGNVQAFAKEAIVLEENVHLRYPSTLFGFNDNDSLRIHIGENSRVLGSIIIDGNTFQGSLKRKLVTERGSLIVGGIYCYGTSDLSGKIYGTIYSDRLAKKTETATYDNTLFNTAILRDSLPDNFPHILPFLKQNCCSYEVVKNL